MERVLEFILNHPLNVFALAMMVLLLIMTEMKRGGKHWTPKQLVSLINDGNSVVIDLRNEKDFEHGHIINSVNHPYSKLNQLADMLKSYQDKEVVVVCANGRQSTTAQLQMKKEGFTASRLNGGLIEWSVANLPLIKGKQAKS
ncbi:MAG: rhodanese-like domain-containing protein [Candidatus Portiera sp.]|nr:rhodanese-like domain-containing protein [Portiera sp.]